MRLGIDVREATSSVRTGKGQWAHGFLQELRQRSVELVEYDKSYGSGLRWHTTVAKQIKKDGVTAYISPTSFIVPALLGTSVPCVPVIHDLIAWQAEPHDKKARFIERLLLPRSAKTAAHFLVNSEATKVDLVQRFPSISSERVTPVFAGPMASKPLPNAPDNTTILCVGTLCPRKNQLRLIQAYTALPTELRDQYQLVLVGSRGWHDDDIVELAHNTPRVTWKDYVPDDEYEQLLTTCTMFAFPSLYEGFGMAVLDAMQRGVPVLTSNRGSLAEVAGDAAVVVNPEEIQSITAGLTAVLTQPTVRTSLAAKGPIQASQFSWSRTVDFTLAALEKALY